ncbi:hypothetical protein [Streptomyces sp. NPDC055085]
MTNHEGKGEIICLIITIMNPDEASAVALTAAYTERWELESKHRT